MTSPGELVYSRSARCPCGAGLAYVKDVNPVDGYWDCSAIWLGTADRDVQHTAQLPFVFYEVKSERSRPDGPTTRPAA